MELLPAGTGPGCEAGLLMGVALEAAEAGPCNGEGALCLVAGLSQLKLPMLPAKGAPGMVGLRLTERDRWW